MITKILLYNAPYEYNSADRFYKDIDTKLVKHFVGEIIDYSFEVTNTTELVVTFNDKAARGSYMAIESSIFKNKKTSYWFLTAITEVESDEGTRYKATLDSIATFGEDVFSKLDGKKVKIDRLHEDRYVLSGGVFNLNKNNHGLINTDFKVGDTKGVELVYDGSNEEKSLTPAQVVGEVRFKNPEGAASQGLQKEDNFDIIIDNILEIENKKYFLYALVQLGGSPAMYDKMITINTNPDNDREYVQVLPDVIDNKSRAIRNSVLCPVSVSSTSANSINTITKLQEGKVLNIIKLPYKIDVKTDAFQLLWDINGKRLNYTITGNEFVTIDGNISTPASYLIDSPIPSKIDAKELYFYKDMTSFNVKDILSIPTSKLNSADIMDFIANTKTPAEMKRIIDAGETERLEVGLLNPDIMPIEMYFHDNKTILDFYNFANKVDKTKIKGSYVFNEMGTEVTLEISENQFAGWSENQIMSFATDQGATYLARNKYSNDAQKKSIDLQAQQAALQAHLQKLQGKDQAGNLVSGLFSLGASTAAGAHQAEYAGQIESLQPKIAAAKKQEIQGSIDDASATAPSIHIGSSHNLINLNTQEKKYNFNWLMKKPNKFLRDKIVEFIDRHGYIFHDWIPFSKGLVETRSRFNYIEMDEFKDFIGTFDDFDINVLNLLDAELKKGLRLWHVDDIDYNSPNLEKVILENI